MTTTAKENPAAPASGDRAQTKSEHPTDSPRPPRVQLTSALSPTAKRAARWLCRDALLALAQAIESRDAAICRDECGDWQIKGQRGHIYAVPGSLDRPNTEGFLLFVASGSARGWTNTKRDLAFAELTQDGDDEGCLFLDRLPTAAEAELIRHRLGIAKKRTVSAAEIERLRTIAG
jgi:hypothetical protein